MTGLDPERHVILEIASLVTDSRLKIIGEGPNLVINYHEGVLRHMDEWSRTHHESSGLLERVRSSRYDCKKAEEETLDFVAWHCKRGACPLCGNSIWQDRRFLIKHMPRLEAFFHYRNIDVSSVKELVKRWYPSFPSFEKKKSHLATQDIKESINELRYYRRSVFVSRIDS
jgi:oligoribonuclease